jgi:hypothetical protein
MRFLAVPLLAGMLSAGCIAVGGSDRYVQPTLGKQLQDLKCAKDSGAITESEYQLAKQNLICGKSQSMGH